MLPGRVTHTGPGVQRGASTPLLAGTTVPGMTRPAAYTIVRTSAGFHVRLLGANHARIVWSEPYTRIARARRAIELACLAAGRAPRPAKAVAAAAELVDERAQ